MENRLSDVHMIANEMIRRGEIGLGNVDAEAPKVVRVERHVASRNAVTMPSAVPFGLDEEIRKLNLQLETIKRSVEFTEAQVAVNRAGTARSQDHVEAKSSRRKSWSGVLLVGANLILAGLLFAEMYDGLVSSISRDLYLEVYSLIGTS